ncbi:MAG TPA: hypothetical protein VEA36_02905, partial [Candidatus Paceibacterota bacterium]|nr:hypothetical protein [Candidatus Paceibacterota bacterium]
MDEPTVPQSGARRWWVVAAAVAVLAAAGAGSYLLLTRQIPSLPAPLSQATGDSLGFYFYDSQYSDSESGAAATVTYSIYRLPTKLEDREVPVFTGEFNNTTRFITSSGKPGTVLFIVSSDTESLVQAIDLISPAPRLETIHTFPVTSIGERVTNARFIDDG